MGIDLSNFVVSILSKMSGKAHDLVNRDNFKFETVIDELSTLVFNVCIVKNQGVPISPNPHLSCQGSDTTCVARSSRDYHKLTLCYFDVHAAG